MHKLPALFLKSNFDDLRDKGIELEKENGGRLSALYMIVEKGLKIAADPIREQEPGLIKVLGDMIEIQVDKPTVVTIGSHIRCKLPEGRWMIPKICLTFDSIEIENKCKVQDFYLDYDERNALMSGGNVIWFQHLGDKSLLYKYGMASEGGPDSIRFDDWFEYKKTFRETGVYEITVQGINHAVVKAIYDQIDDCPAVLKCTEPLIFSWLVAGRADPMYFTITTEELFAVCDWLSEHGDGSRFRSKTKELVEDITLPEEIQEQYQAALAQRLEGLRKLVNVGILETFE